MIIDYLYSWRTKQALESSNVTSTIPISIHRDAMRRPKQNSVSSFTDLSFTDASSIHNEKEPTAAEKGTSVVPPLSYDQLSFCDIGGVLADNKA